MFYLRLKLGVEPEVDDGVHTDGGLGEHGGDAQDVVGEGGVGDVAGSLGYGDTSIGEPGQEVGD